MVSLDDNEMEENLICPKHEFSFFIVLFQSNLFNTFKPNGFSQYYQLAQFIFRFKGCWELFFIFIQTLIEHSASNQGKP